MPKNDNIVVGIDVGTHKVCTVVAEAEAGPGSRFNVLGVGAVASEGLQKGMITDIVKASGAVAGSLEAAERQSGCRILSAYVSISGNHVTSQNSRGLVAVSRTDRIIGGEDVARAVEAARAMAAPSVGREVLHCIPRAYTVDGQDGIRNPVGLSGFRLDVETHVVTGGSNVRENLIRCVQGADVEVDDLVLAPLASAEAVLTQQEKNLGVALVDIGHGTTDIAIYAEGAVWHTRVLPLGGWHLTNDLVIVFNIPYEAAEALKLQYGQAGSGPIPNSFPLPRPNQQAANGKIHPNGTYARAYAGDNGAYGDSRVVGNGIELHAWEPEDETLEAQTFEGATRPIRRSELNEVMAARLDQLFGMIGDEIRRSGYEGLLPAGVVLTGGVAAMEGIEQLASHKLRMPVRTGRPQRIGGLADAFESPAYSTSVGLVLWGMSQGSVVQTPRQSRPNRKSNKGRGWQSWLADWLRGFSPRSQHSYDD